MEITINEDSKDIHWILLRGDFLSNNPDILLDFIREKIGFQKKSRFLIDLGHISRINSPFIGGILKLYRRILETDGAILFFQPSPNIQNVFKHLKMEEVLPFCFEKESIFPLLDKQFVPDGRD